MRRNGAALGTAGSVGGCAAVTVAPGVSAARLADIERATWADVDRDSYSTAAAQIAAVQAKNSAALIRMDASEAEIRALAERRAELMMDRVALLAPLSFEAFKVEVNAQLLPLQGRQLRAHAGAINEGQARRGMVGRVTCKSWWVRALRRAVTEQREAAGRAAALVCASRQPYITNETMRRRMNQDAQNRAMLEATELENEDGQVFTLAKLAEKSTSNPAIRRGELMTRIRGCEEWAQANGMVGLFTTQTTPSRYHATHRHGGTNEKWTAAGRPTPKDGQQWLCKAWARARAELDRRGLSFYGFRVAEPHHDGTPHWHGLLFCRPQSIGRIAVVIRRQWLKDAGDEAGAKEHRAKFLRMESGGASGYIAKYIAKGIDDAGAMASGHVDEQGGEVVAMDQGDMFGGGAARVAAWARSHGIRQFQALGQPPVTVWRELRRVTQAQAVAGSDRIAAMWSAAQRDVAKRASWAVYMVRQGGAMVGRNYRVGVDVERVEHQGRYETISKDKPVGVVDKVQDKRAASERKEWRPRGAWGVTVTRPKASPPWTRVNNCTRRQAETIAGVPVSVIKRQEKRLMTWAEVMNRSWNGGPNHERGEKQWQDKYSGTSIAQAAAHPKGCGSTTTRT